MRHKLKKLAGQTAIYGIPSIVARVINFGLTPIYLLSLKEVGDFGVMAVMYAIAAFIAVVLTHGMETGFFNFVRKEEENPEEVFNTAFSSVLLISLLFAVLCFVFSNPIIEFIGYPGKGIYIQVFALILCFDALSAIPFAWLRYENKAVKFAGIRSLNIAVNVVLTLFFFLLCPYLQKNGHGDLVSFFKQEDLVLYAFIANLTASLVSFSFLLPQMKFKFGFANKPLRRKMLLYSYPLIFTGMAGIVNETFDRVLLKKLLPADVADHEIGIYNAFYKLSMFMTLFVQAFRYAAEPFFFQESKQQDAKQSYAKIMEYFVYACLGIFMILVLLLPYIAPLFITNKDYFINPDGMRIVPVLLLANMFLGIYYNLAIWYKLTHKNLYGAYIGIGGALLTLILNFVFIPSLGFVASAWITLLVYFSMTVVSYLVGQRHYAVPYPIKKIILAILIVVGSYSLWYFS